MTHPVLSAGRVAVVTGAAGGIGLATCRHALSLGMKLCAVDLGGEALDRAHEGLLALAGGDRDRVLAHAADVSDGDAVAALCDRCFEHFGGVHFLMNNAACFPPSRTQEVWEEATKSVSRASPDLGEEALADFGHETHCIVDNTVDRPGGSVRPQRLLLLVVLLILVLGACSAGANPEVGVAPADGDVAGFWLGLWHGIIAPITFLISLFSDTVNVYEVHNSGNWYNFGFLLGGMMFFGGSCGSAGQKRKKDSRCNKEAPTEKAVPEEKDPETP